MELKSPDTPSVKYVLLYGACGFLYAAGVCLPGVLIADYCLWLGTGVLSTVLFFSIRSHILAVFALAPESCGEPPRDPPKVSLVIPSYNEEAVLRRTIPTALALDYPRDRLELIYMYESACTDATEDVIRDFGRFDSRIRSQRRFTCHGGKAAAVNEGIRAATGEIIGIFDADHSLEPDLVRRAVSKLEEEDVGCVRGRCRPINRTESLIARLGALERDIIERLGICGASRMEGFANFGGGHGFFRREIFTELGPFDEEILTEDIDFSVKMHLAGYRVAVLPEMQSWEEVPVSLMSLVQQRKRWARGWMQVWRKHWRAVLTARGVSLAKRLDILVSLASSLMPGFLILLLPLLVLACWGIQTSCLAGEYALAIWLYATFAPVSLAGLVWGLDRRRGSRPCVVDLAAVPLLIPYILLLLSIGWLSFIDEFVLYRPYAFVKTERTGTVSVALTSDRTPAGVGCAWFEEEYSCRT